jgi:hypothetical protein
MAEIIRRANSAPGTPSVKSYSSFAKASRSVLKRIASLHAHRKTPPPLPPNPPPSKKTKKQLELEEKWEEERFGDGVRGSTIFPLCFLLRQTVFQIRDE